VRPKSDWFHDSHSFSLTPEYKRDMKIAGLTSDETAFIQSGDDLYFQRVPTDLTELAIKVSVNYYGKREVVILGSVRLTRRGPEQEQKRGHTCASAEPHPPRQQLALSARSGP
jgi:hypothetical protein